LYPPVCSMIPPPDNPDPMATMGVNGYRASRNTPDGWWSGIPRLNVLYVCGVIQNRVIPSALAGTDPKLIQFIWLVNERRNAPHSNGGLELSVPVNDEDLKTWSFFLFAVALREQMHESGIASFYEQGMKRIGLHLHYHPRPYKGVRKNHE